MLLQNEEMIEIIMLTTDTIILENHNHHNKLVIIDHINLPELI